MPSIMALPPEVLLEIFGYVSPEELLDNVHNVCTAWRQIARHPSLWDDFVYVTKQHLSFEDAVRFVERCPMVKHFNIYIRVFKKFGLEEFVSAVVKNCSDVRTFVVDWAWDCLKLSQIDAIFEAFPNIEYFKITIGSQNAEQTIDRISRCTQLKKLIVKSSENCGGWLRPMLHGCVSLEYLCFMCPAIPESEYLYILENMRDRLSYLKSSIDQPATQQTVNLLGCFSQLKELNLYHYKHCGQVNFLSLANIKTLKVFNFSSDAPNIDLVDTIFDAVFVSPFPHLQELSFNIYCCKWGRSVLKDICRCYPNLRALHLWSKPRGDARDSFEDICRLGRLESLVYHDSSSIVDDDTGYIARCPRLKHLDLRGCDGLSDKTVVQLATCTSLESLNLSYCAISGESLLLILEYLVRLKKLEIYGIKAGRKFVDAVTKMMPALDVCY